MSEVRLDPGGRMEAHIVCPAEGVPHAGQYLLASDLDNPFAALGTPLFLAGRSRDGFWSAPPLPAEWAPGTNLHLVGPLGHGFSLPGATRRLGLAAMGDTAARLMPLVRQAAEMSAAMTLFSDLSLPQIPASLEVFPLGSLADMLDWPDFLAIDLPLDTLPGLRRTLRLPDGSGLPCPAQLLITTPMPCAGLARCYACAVPGRRGWKCSCEDGPVFDLNLLKW